jgi:hypothetical protein
MSGLRVAVGHHPSRKSVRGFTAGVYPGFYGMRLLAAHQRRSKNAPTLTSCQHQRLASSIEEDERCTSGWRAQG